MFLKKSHIIKLLIAFIIFISLLVNSSIFHSYKVYADSAITTDKNTLIDEDYTASTYGVFTSLSLAIDGNNGEVWAIAKNKITIFPATVRVIIELYSSDTYQNSHQSMTLVAKNNINDLDMGHTIEARTSTNGKQKYWKARMCYKVDNDDWTVIVTDTILLDKNGVLIIQ